MLELNELHVFLMAAETQNFSETGRILQISQPAVSGHIQSLEQRLNAQLFDRTGRNIKLNEVGEALVPVVRSLLKQAQEIEEFVARKRGAVLGQLNIVCSTAAGKYILPRLMARFIERYPDVHIVCDVGQRGLALERLVEGKTDLAVSSLRVPRRAVEYKHLADDNLVLLVPATHPWADRERITPEELVDYPIILREPNSGTAITINRALAAFDMSIHMLQTHLILGNTESIVQAVIEGIGPGIVSQVATGPATSIGAAVEVPIDGLPLIQRLYMARHTGFRAGEAQTIFWDFAFAPENEDVRLILTQGK